MQAVSWGSSPAYFSRAVAEKNSISPCNGINTDFQPHVPKMGKTLRFAGNGKVTILSWNVKGQYLGINPDGSINKENPTFQARVRMLKRIIEKYEPEILGFQECPHNLLRAFQEELGIHYPHIFYGAPGAIPMRLQVGMLVRRDVEVMDMDSPKLKRNGRGILRGKFQLGPKQIVYVDVAHYLSLLGTDVGVSPSEEAINRAKEVATKKLNEAQTHAALVRADMDREIERKRGTVVLEPDSEEAIRRAKAATIDFAEAQVVRLHAGADTDTLVSPRYAVMDANIKDDELGRELVETIERETGLREAKQDRDTYRNLKGEYGDARFDRAFGPEGTTLEVVADFDDPDIKKAKADHLPVICIGPAYAIQRETQRLAVAFAGNGRRVDFVA
jgi:hypothetical protein